MYTKEAIAEIDEKIREMTRVLAQLNAQRKRMVDENNKVKLAIHQMNRLAIEEKSE